jgi:ABC-type transport system involved in multi-copper enzyme maturation permease subunit
MKAILQRELLVAARSYRLGWLRAAVGTGAVVTLAFSSVGEGSALRGSGESLFNTFFAVGALGLLLLTPAVTCDVISRERREGTLGLLMMTPLSVKAVVLGKAVAGGLRTGVMWLAMVPVLMVPMLMGGVSVADLVTGLVIQWVLGGLGLAAGLLASSWNTRAGSALFAAYCIEGAVLLVAGLPGVVLLSIALDAGANYLLCAALGAACAAFLIGLLVRVTIAQEYYQWLVYAASVAAPLAGGGVGLESARWQRSSQALNRLKPSEASPGPSTVHPPASESPTVSSGQATAQRRRSPWAGRRVEDPLGWLFRRLVSPGDYIAVAVGTALLGFWSLMAWITHSPPVAVTVLLMLVVAYRSVGIGRGEAESGMLEMLQVTPLGRDLPGAALRVLGRELGPFVLLHGVGCLILVRFMGEARDLVSLLLLVGGALAAAWVGQWGTSRVRSLLLSRVAVLLGVFLLPWWGARIGFPALFPPHLRAQDPAWLTGLGCVVALGWQGLVAWFAARRVRADLVQQRRWGSPRAAGSSG